MSEPEHFSPPDAALLEQEAATLGLGAQQADAGAGDRTWSVLADRSEALMRIDGVVMVGRGSTEIGDDAILVGVRHPDHLRALPATLDGLPVRGEVIGQVDALAKDEPGRKPRRKP